MFSTQVAIALLRRATFYDFVPAERAAPPPAARDAAPPLEQRAAARRHFNVVCVGLALNVITKGCIGCYETLGVNYAQSNLGLSGPTTGYYVSACGVVGVAFLLSFRCLGRCFDDVELMVGGVSVMVASCVLMISRAHRGHDFAVWVAALAAMYAVGYPVGHTAAIGWFSKAMGRRPQGMLMGLFASAGSLARIVFPVATGLVADAFGSDAVFATLAALLGATFVVLVAFGAAFRKAIE